MDTTALTGTIDSLPRYRLRRFVPTTSFVEGLLCTTSGTRTQDRLGAKGPRALGHLPWPHAHTDTARAVAEDGGDEEPF